MKRFAIALLAAVSCLALSAQEIQSQWKGARVAYLGDSITDASQLNSQDVFWHQLEKILGTVSYVYGISGDRTCSIKGQAEKLAAEHGQDFDAIIIFIGTNDFNSSVPLGSWYTEETLAVNKNGQDILLKHRVLTMERGKVRSDVNVFMSYIKHNFPTKQVILLTPIHRAYFNHSETNIQPDESYANSLGLYIDDYVNVIKEAGNVWAVPVIDLNSICGLYPLDKSNVLYFREAGMDADGVRHDLLHPNTEGHLRMAYSIAYQLLGYPATF